MGKYPNSFQQFVCLSAMAAPLPNTSRTVGVRRTGFTPQTAHSLLSPCGDDSQTIHVSFLFTVSPDKQRISCLLVTTALRGAFRESFPVAQKVDSYRLRQDWHRRCWSSWLAPICYSLLMGAASFYPLVHFTHVILPQLPAYGGTPTPRLPWSSIFVRFGRVFDIPFAA